MGDEDRQNSVEEDPKISKLLFLLYSTLRLNLKTVDKIKEVLENEIVIAVRKKTSDSNQ